MKTDDFVLFYWTNQKSLEYEDRTINSQMNMRLSIVDPLHLISDFKNF